jgi:indole-3-glycerol phosphate synthase
VSVRLDELVGATREAVHRRKRERPLAELEREAGSQPEGRPFAEALARPGTSLIAEHKRRSPSAGTIREGLNCADVVGAYERGGAAALSVLTEEELVAALEVDADVLGINNRNLEDFSVDIQRTFDLLHDVPAGKVVVSESGIHTREQIDELEQVGVDAVLIGEALMRAHDPEEAVRQLTRPEDSTQA